MKKLFLALIVLGFMVSAAVAQPGYNTKRGMGPGYHPPTQQQVDKREWQQERQRDQYEQVQREQQRIDSESQQRTNGDIFFHHDD
jgi:Ni/Co efflux regulator RcnB